jgi:glucokinase
MVDSTGGLRSSPHLPGLVGLPIARDLAARFPDARVWVGNDATGAGWAEHSLGAAVGVDDLLMVTLGTGIGGGIVAGGRLLEGAHRYAGEVGHIIIDPNGPPCPCGQRGCWERMASGSGLGRLAREWATAGRAPGVVALAGGDPEAVRGEHVTTAAASRDGDAIKLMGELAWWLALGLANLTNVLDPGLVVVGGGLAEAGEVLIAPAREAFARLVEGHRHRPGLALVVAALGERAGAVGAGLLAARGGTRLRGQPSGWRARLRR